MNVMIDVDYDGYDHAFVVCNTDRGQVVVDSYVNVRSVEWRFVDLRKMLLYLMRQRS